MILDILLRSFFQTVSQKMVAGILGDMMTEYQEVCQV